VFVAVLKKRKIKEINVALAMIIEEEEEKSINLTLSTPPKPSFL
jgi:hypothetical protein